LDPTSSNSQSSSEQTPDAQLADAERLITALDGFIETLEAWTIPAGTGARPDRRVQNRSAPFALETARKELLERFWAARERLYHKHRQRADDGPEDSELRGFMYVVGPGGADYTLFTAIDEVLALLRSPSLRSEHEAKASKRGVPDNPALAIDDVIAWEAFERLHSARRLLQIALKTPQPVDPLAPKYKPGRVMIISAPAEPATKSKPAAPRLDGPSSLLDARLWLITRDRLLKHLNLRGAPWLEETWNRHKPIPAWKAPAGSGRHSLYRLGELYDSFKRSANRTIPPLQPGERLYRLLNPPETPAETPQGAPSPKSGLKRSKAPPTKKSPF
jgi:hypothetical protein